MKLETTLNPVDKLKWRYATKQFDASKKIDPTLWSNIEEALILSPSSFGLQPYKFVVITDPSTKEMLKPLSFNQPQITDCSHLVVFCRLNKIDENYVNDFTQMTASIRNMPLDILEHYKSMMTGFVNNTPVDKLNDWMARQAYIALGNALAVASMYDIDSCPMEGFNKLEYDKALKLDQLGLNSEVLLALGYRHADDKYAKLSKVRYSRASKIIHI